MAEGLLKQRYPDKTIGSAGLREITVGWSADPFSIRVMREHGVDISRHRARLLTNELLKDVDLVITMEKEQSDIVKYSFPNFKGKIIRVGEYGNYDVPDPYSKNIKAFEESFKLISQGIDQIDSHLMQPEKSAEDGK